CATARRIVWRRGWNERQHRRSIGVDGNRCGVSSILVRTVRSGTKIREVPSAFCGGGNRHAEGGRSVLSAPLLGPEEKCLLLVRVVVVRDVQGAPEGVTKVMLFVRRSSQGLSVGVRGGIEEIAGIEELVAEVFVG